MQDVVTFNTLPPGSRKQGKQTDKRKMSYGYKSIKQELKSRFQYSQSQRFWQLEYVWRGVCVACQMELNKALTLCWGFPSVFMFQLWMCGFCMWSVGNEWYTKSIYKNVQYRNVTHFPDAQYTYIRRILVILNMPLKYFFCRHMKVLKWSCTLSEGRRKSQGMHWLMLARERKDCNTLLYTLH